MKFLVLTSPTTRFLVNKYIGNLSAPLQVSTAVKKFNAHEILLPEESNVFVQVLTELHANLVANNLVNRIASIRKLVGSGPKWKGILNLLFEMGHELYIYSYEPGSIQALLEPFQKLLSSDLSAVRVIAPLGLDEMEEIYSFFHSLIKVPVYPFIQNFVTSKWLAEFTFAPYAPRAFFFPQGTNACDFIEKIEKIMQNDHVRYLILKDEYDFDLRAIIPYSLAPVNTLHQFLAQFYSKAEGITNIGGLILEEFLNGENKILVSKSHIFNALIPGGDIRSIQNLKPHPQGGLLDEFVDHVIDEKIEVPHPFIHMLNPLVKRFYLDLFASIDFIIQNNVPRVIDVNSVANSFSYLTQPTNIIVDNLYKFFLSQVIETKNDDGLLAQAQYQSAISRLYQAIRKIGPAYIDGERVVSLTDMVEINLKNLVEENFK